MRPLPFLAGVGSPAAQEHFIDLCRMLGKPTSAEVEDDTILIRLLALNQERSAYEANPAGET